MPAVFLLAYYLLRRGKFLNKPTPLILLASLLNALRMILYFFAFTYSQISCAVIILFSWPLFAAVFSRLLLGERIAPGRMIMLFIAFSGVLLIFSTGSFSLQDSSFLGMGAMLMSAVIFALTVVLFKKESAGYSNLETVFYQNILAALVFLPLFLDNRPLPETSRLITAAGYALLIGLVGYGLFFAALKRLSAVTASFYAYTEVISGVFIGVMFFSETPGPRLIGGGLCIIIPMILYHRI